MLKKELHQWIYLIIYGSDFEKAFYNVNDFYIKALERDLIIVWPDGVLQCNRDF